MSKADQNAAQQSADRGMPNPKKMGGTNANQHGLRDVDKDTTPVKSTDKVGNQRPGSSQGNVSNRGG